MQDYFWPLEILSSIQSNCFWKKRYFARKCHFCTFIKIWTKFVILALSFIRLTYNWYHYIWNLNSFIVVYRTLRKCSFFTDSCLVTEIGQNVYFQKMVFLMKNRPYRDYKMISNQPETLTHYRESGHTQCKIIFGH